MLCLTETSQMNWYITKELCKTCGRWLYPGFNPLKDWKKLSRSKSWEPYWESLLHSILQGWTLTSLTSSFGGHSGLKVNILFWRKLQGLQAALPQHWYFSLKFLHINRWEKNTSLKWKALSELWRGRIITGGSSVASHSGWAMIIIRWAAGNLSARHIFLFR